MSKIIAYQFCHTKGSAYFVSRRAEHSVNEVLRVTKKRQNLMTTSYEEANFAVMYSIKEITIYPEKIVEALNSRPCQKIGCFRLVFLAAMTTYFVTLIKKSCSAE